MEIKDIHAINEIEEQHFNDLICIVHTNTLQTLFFSTNKFAVCKYIGLVKRIKASVVHCLFVLKENENKWIMA